MKEKFRKFLPVVVDMETGGFDPVNDALLEIAITLIDYDKEFRVGTTHRHHIIPFEGLNVSEESLEFTGICLLYTSPSPRDRTRSRMPSSA